MMMLIMLLEEVDNDDCAVEEELDDDDCGVGITWWTIRTIVNICFSPPPIVSCSSPPSPSFVGSGWEFVNVSRITWCAYRLYIAHFAKEQSVGLPPFADKVHSVVFDRYKRSCGLKLFTNCHLVERLKVPGNDGDGQGKDEYLKENIKKWQNRCARRCNFDNLDNNVDNNLKNNSNYGDGQGKD